jgi:hypothetical protein
MLRENWTSLGLIRHMNVITSEVVPTDCPLYAFPEDEQRIVHPASTTNPLAEFVGLLRKHFYKPDIQALQIVLGAIQAHRLNIGDPAWLFVVAPPGSGKTTMSIMGSCGLHDVIQLGDFSENTFLSGFFGHKQPGILEKLGQVHQEGQTYITCGNAVFLAKDFTTVLSMRREKRAAILSHLREIHDGQFKRDFGTGDTKIWKGRVTIIAAVTPVLDRYYSVFSTLGERFLQVRWHRPDSEEAGVWAIEQQGRESKLQDQMRDTVRRVFEAASKAPPFLPKVMQQRIACLAEIIAIARTHVYRSSYGNREIEYAPEPEANTRVSKGLAAIAKGTAAIRGRNEVTEQELQDTFRVGLDCLQDYRRRVFLAVANGVSPSTLPISKTMRGRELEDLEELNLISKDESGAYEITDRIQRLWKTAGVK